MFTLNEKLQRFHQAQQELYNHLGISRRLTNGEMSLVDGILHANHGSGNEDIPTSFPQVLDYRGRAWRKASDHKNADDEIHIEIDTAETFDGDNRIRFNTLSIWSGTEVGQPTVFVYASHLPRPEELAYAFPGEVARVEEGRNFYGDEVVLLLDPAFALPKVFSEQ